MAEHFEEVVGLRLSQLEARADAEETAVKAYFHIKGWVQRELNEVRSELRQVHERLDAVEQKMDAHHEVTQGGLRDILARLAPAEA